MTGHAPRAGPSEGHPEGATRGQCGRAARSAGAWRVRERCTLAGGYEDRGSASILVVGVCAMVLCLTMAALDVARAVETSHRARAAADLAALAAANAGAVGATADAACARAADLAARNAARLQTCAVTGACVRVTVEATSSRPWPLSALAHARAGPAGATSLGC